MIPEIFIKTFVHMDNTFLLSENVFFICHILYTVYIFTNFSYINSYLVYFNRLLLSGLAATCRESPNRKMIKSSHVGKHKISLMLFSTYSHVGNFPTCRELLRHPCYFMLFHFAVSLKFPTCVPDMSVTFPTRKRGVFT